MVKTENEKKEKTVRRSIDSIPSTVQIMKVVVKMRFMCIKNVGFAILRILLFLYMYVCNIIPLSDSSKEFLCWNNAIRNHLQVRKVV